MKLSQLKQIIKEELNELGFNYPGKTSSPSPYQLGIMDTLKAIQQLGVNVDVNAVMDILYPDDESPVNENPINETEGKNKYFIIVNSEGQSDELGNFHGIEASNQKDFKQKFKDTFKEDISDYYTFYEVPNKQMMDKIVKLSNQWEGGEDTRETKMLQNIADKAKKFNGLNL